MTRLLLSLLLAFSLAACSGTDDTKAAEQSVASFHKAMDSGQYAAIYDGAAADMKTSISKENFVRMFTGMREKLGPYKSGKTVGWNVNYGTGGNYVTLNRQSEFQRGPGTEEFVFRMQDGRAMLAGYHVNSAALVTN